MKKNYLILLILLLSTTGCTCEYNLKIDNNTYSEEVILFADNSNEQSNFNNKWQIPVDKDEYNIGLDIDSNNVISGSIYKSNFSGNKLTFNYDFGIDNYQNSAAVSNCYNKFNVTNYNGSIIISTSPNTICFSKYPDLSSVVVNITVDKPVTSSNADRISGKTYTWNLSNSNNKSINLVLESSVNYNNESNNNNNNNNNENNSINRKNDYSMYICAVILLIFFLSGYFIFNKIKSKDEAI